MDSVPDTAHSLARENGYLLWEIGVEAIFTPIIKSLIPLPRVSANLDLAKGLRFSG